MLMLRGRAAYAVKNTRTTNTSFYTFSLLARTLKNARARGTAHPKWGGTRAHTKIKNAKGHDTPNLKWGGACGARKRGNLFFGVQSAQVTHTYPHPNRNRLGVESAKEESYAALSRPGSGPHS